MKKIKVVLLVFLSLIVCGCTTTKEKPSEELFLSVMKENGISPTKVTEEYDYSDYAYTYIRDDIEIFFLDSKSTNTVNGVFLDESKNLLNKLEDNDKKTALSGDNWASLSTENKDEYNFIGLIDDTYIIFKANFKNKGFVTRIVRALGY